MDGAHPFTVSKREHICMGCENPHPAANDGSTTSNVTERGVALRLARQVSHAQDGDGAASRGEENYPSKEP